jgi:hypothetical protein
MPTFCAWVVLLVDEAADQVISGMVRSGYSVGPLSSTTVVYTGDPKSVSHALGISLTTQRAIDATEAYGDLMRVLDKYRVRTYFQLVAPVATGTCQWGTGTLKFPEEATPVPTHPSRMERAAQEDIAK